jgi:4-hydroxybenzoate polyprenyltransferase
MRHYLQLFRIHHWIKNFLVLIPLIFSISLFNAKVITSSVLGFFCFSLLSSIVYVLNDMRDIEKDRLHTVKCRRPLASGEIPLSHAIISLVILSAFLLSFLTVLWALGNRLYYLKSIGLLLLYMLSNIGYSLGLKNIPIVDVTILASGYVIRVLFGALIIGVDISVWLYLVITMGAFYWGLGKRRNEITGNEEGKRDVMRFYSHNFLDKNMYVCQTLCVVFYALWSIDPETTERFHTSAFVYTIPLILIIFLKYSLNIETDIEGDPVSVLLSDKILLLLCVTYIVYAFCIIYLNRVAL